FDAWHGRSFCAVAMARVAVVRSPRDRSGDAVGCSRVVCDGGACCLCDSGVARRESRARDRASVRLKFQSLSLPDWRKSRRLPVSSLSKKSGLRMADESKRVRLRPHLWLVFAIGVTVPRRLRGDWRQEWEA